MSTANVDDSDPILIERFKMLSSLAMEPSVEAAMLEIAQFHTAKLHNDYERHIKAEGSAANIQSARQLHHATQ